MIDPASGPLQDPAGLYTAALELSRDEGVRGLPLIMGFTGFADAGHAVRQISEELISVQADGALVAFDVDQLLDYRSRRPRIRFVEDHLEDYDTPKLALYRLEDGLGRPYLLLSGPEPDLQWERFARAVVGLVEELEVSQTLWVHAIPMPVPHTRPLGVTVHGNRPELVEGISRWKPVVEFPAAVGHLIELRLIEAGHDVTGFVVHVPHYLAEAEYPAAAVTGLEHLGAAASLMLPSDRLREAAREVERQVADQVAASEDIREVISGLEERFDDRSAEVPRRSLLAGSADELPSAEDLGAAVEAYLASHGEADAARDTETGDGAGSPRDGDAPHGPDDAGGAPRDNPPK
ncbi:PAC2 family protein [Sinomonas sp. ASV486]|uniref:Proteasome assembly chaperone family protein n=1 Tax=Sinomonas puerhi TaxID=3238584 RepID=A0AB39L959_9MICC|nr:PAC2 family protein [Sinomonas sp. ASV486]MDQ4489707.1 PAC2 family protein [Sinomonas sp. ASV486]